MAEAPSPFVTLPNGRRLQYAWDSTSLKSLMFCPRRYEYEILEGWRGSAVELEFGGLLASAWERFQKARIEGLSRDGAMMVGLEWLIDETAAKLCETCHGTGATGDPWPPYVEDPRCADCHGRGSTPAWGGTYETLWRCTGTEKFKNAKGNAAKCPFSHKGKWFPMPAPETCSCGSPTEQARLYQPHDKLRHRESLLRTYVWYCDDQPEELEDGLHPLRLPDGSAAVELSFTIPLPWKTGDRHGSPAYTHENSVQYLLCGHLDYIGELGDEMFICDNKSTGKTLGPGFWAGYEPDAQIDTYDLSGTLLFPTLPIRGVLLDAAQVLQGGAKFGRHIYYHTEAQREEWLADIRNWLTRAEEYAAAGHYPMNKAVCWVCPFKGICSKDPSKRQMYLEQAFEKRPWNPLEER